MKRSFPPLLSVIRRVPGRCLIGLAASLLCAAAFSACTDGTDIPRDNTPMLPENERVSSQPWNQKQGWENTSQLGALQNNPRIGGTQQ